MTIQTNKDIIINKGLVKEGQAIKVPKAIASDFQGNKSEHLPVYTQNKWVSDFDEVPDINVKDKPTLAKLAAPALNASSLVTII